MKTSEYQRKAVDEYIKKQKAKGFVKYARDIKPEWKQILDNLYNHLKNSDNAVVDAVDANQAEDYYKQVITKVHNVIERWCKRNPDEWMSHRKLCNYIRFIKSRELNEILQQLHNAGKVKRKEALSKNGATFYKYKI